MFGLRYNSIVHEFREKKRFRKFLYSNITIIGLVLLIIFIGKGVWSLYEKKEIALTDRTDVEARVLALQDRQKFLEKEVADLKTENGIEREIRGKFNVKKPGEEVVIIVESTTTAEVKESKASYFEGIKTWLKSLLVGDARD